MMPSTKLLIHVYKTRHTDEVSAQTLAFIRDLDLVPPEVAAEEIAWIREEGIALDRERAFSVYRERFLFAEFPELFHGFGDELAGIFPPVVRQGELLEFEVVPPSCSKRKSTKSKRKYEMYPSH